MDHDCECICNLEHWKPFQVPIFDGSSCVLTTDTTCLRNINAAAVLALQAKFRYEYCPRRSNTEDEMDDDEVQVDFEVSFLSDIEFELKEHVSALCEEFEVGYVHTTEWLVNVLDEISKCLNAAAVDSEFLPLTGHIDFVFLGSASYLLFVFSNFLATSTRVRQADMRELVKAG